MSSSRLRQFGFSILELVITLAIGAVLLGLAVPSMKSIMGDSEIATTSNHFVYSLQNARSEAIKRAGPVGVCPSTNSQADEPACNGSNYGAGWIVFHDNNGNGSRDSGERVILQAQQSSAAFTFTADTVFNQRIYFSESGANINPAGVPLSGTVRIAYADSETREVYIAGNGRITTTNPNESGGS